MKKVKKNFKEAIVAFIGGLGVVPILMAIFMNNIDFGLGIVIGFVFFLIAGTLYGLIMVTPGQLGPITLYRQQKNAVTSLIGGLGILVILMGLFGPSLTFEYSIVIAYCFFLISGVLSILIEVKPSKNKKERYYPPTNESFSDLGKKSSTTDLINYCSSCSRQMEADSIFCNNCGAEINS